VSLASTASAQRKRKERRHSESPARPARRILPDDQRIDNAIAKCLAPGKLGGQSKNSTPTRPKNVDVVTQCGLPPSFCCGRTISLLQSPRLAPQVRLDRSNTLIASRLPPGNLALASILGIYRWVEWSFVVMPSSDIPL